MFSRCFNKPLLSACISCRDIALSFRPESTYEVDDKANQQNQANTTAADDWTAKVKPATAEQKKQHK